MSGVHGNIALAAMSVQPMEIKKLVSSYGKELEISSWYPDHFADLSNIESTKKTVGDPDAERFIYPPIPKTEWYEKILELTKEQSTVCDSLPLRQEYLIPFYLKNAVDSFRKGDVKSAVKYCGVYSHTIGDITEPVHALGPRIVDKVLPPPKKYMGLELHANVEGLMAPVNIKGYKPKLLGANLASAEMSAYAALEAASREGNRLMLPIVQALYAGDKGKAIKLSSEAQNFSAKTTADFIYTTYCIAKGKTGVAKSGHLDLCSYPYLSCSVDMLYRYMPQIDMSLVPYSGGKSQSLCFSEKDGKSERKVHGIGVIPFCGPPYVLGHKRETSIDYFIVPGAYGYFTAEVGTNPRFKSSIVSVSFSVRGDGKDLYHSKIFRPGDPPVKIKVKLGKTKILTLAMNYESGPTIEDKGEIPSIQWATHGVWGNPTLA